MKSTSHRNVKIPCSKCGNAVLSDKKFDYLGCPCNSDELATFDDFGNMYWLKFPEQMKQKPKPQRNEESEGPMVSILMRELQDSGYLPDMAFADLCYRLENKLSQGSTLKDHIEWRKSKAKAFKSKPKSINKPQSPQQSTLKRLKRLKAKKLK